MTIPQRIIEQAIEGGYLPCKSTGCDGNGTITNWKYTDGDPEPEAEQCEYCYRFRFPLLNDASSIALDPLFWQALGKALGWEKLDKEKLDLYHRTGIGGDMPQGMYLWHKKVHRFYDLILTGGDTEKFWEEILPMI